MKGSSNLLNLVPCLGTLDRITIHPGRSMKVIATITGPIKKYAGHFIKNLF